jgi:hypothetical protein
VEMLFIKVNEIKEKNEDIKWVIIIFK